MDADSRAFSFGLHGPKRPQTPPLSPLRCRPSSPPPAAAIDCTSQNQMSKSRHYHSHSPSDLETAMAVAMEARSPPPPPPQKQEVWLPWLMPCFVLANALAFGYSMYSNDCPSRHADEPSACVLYPLLGRFSFEPMSSNSLLGPSPYTLDKLGALDYKKIVVEGERWRLISCIWLHTGGFHLLANMLSLLFVGVRLEQEFGFVKIGTLYMLSGFGGSLMSCLSIKAKLSVGASGALFGLLGSMVSELITNWTIYANKCEALLTLIVVIAINLAIGILPHVDSSAHVGGFISGFFLGFILLIRPQFGWIHREHIPPRFDMQLIKPKYKVYQLLLWLLALFTLIIWFLNCLVKLFVIRKKNAV